MTTLALTLGADFAEVPRLAAWVEGNAATFGMTERQVFSIQLCLEEVVANLIMHARPAGGVGITITVRVEDAPLRVTVEDDALPFDLTGAMPATAPASLEAATPGGLGLGLVAAYTTSRAYRSENGRNRLVLGFA